MSQKDIRQPQLKLAIDCPHFKAGSSCCIEVEFGPPPVLEEARRFFKSLGFVHIPLYQGSYVHWRTRAKLPIRGTATKPLIGLYQRGTHKVVPVPHCRMHHPAINLAVEQLKRWIQAEKMAPYKEEDGGGLLRYVQLVVERHTHRVQLTLVVNADVDVVFWRRKLAGLWAKGQKLWHSLWLNFNVRRDNVIFGTEWHLAYGEAFLWEKLAGVEVCFQPANFAQANMPLFAQMLQAIQQAVPHGKRVVELYAGVGAIGLALAHQSGQVMCSDVNAAGLDCFLRSQKCLPDYAARRITWQKGSAAQLISWLESADVVIVDPPRSGLDHLLREALGSNVGLEQLVYVSCGWKSFTRDCLWLLSHGWKLALVEFYLFFPGSDHIETLAIFQPQ